ncbi:GNAT family N-acetyltransferase [Agromyces sp. NBRC 114283]|uniref:GNAT family N-acetyltransferase n=1 Tax=Agromyces sp. NBRC 114283 TaxID=2994521 RepID=UPI0024A37D17|nr:GNAT family N-acetyltransferase [Agromyces sp. NBRC 114283]GLU89315.1 N-acetyltransferase [Agromyces sp. NBRC 114283]
MAPYVFSNSADRLDRALVHRWLSTLAYWAEGRSRATQDAAIDTSRNYGVYDEETGAQLAYARVVTDGATFAWLCDVFVDPDARGTGLGKLLMTGVAADLDALGVPRTLLATSDAHGLYRQYGFVDLPEPAKYLVRRVEVSAGSAD